MSTPSRYAVAGNPVAHSQSPFIHAEFARQTGEAMTYDRLLCPLDAFAATVRAFAAGGGAGCNVTMPFKFEAFALAAERTPRAALAEACNCLRFDAGGWTGDNTDGAGLVADLDRQCRRRAARGAGAAGRRRRRRGRRARAAARRRPGRAGGRQPHRKPRRRAGERGTRRRQSAAGTVLRASALEGAGRAFDVVVNASASSVAGAAVPVAAAVLRPGALALDMMYGPPAEPFLAWARGHGAIGRDGLGMLVEQAAEAFFFWRGVRPRTGRSARRTARSGSTRR